MGMRRTRDFRAGALLGACALLLSLALGALSLPSSGAAGVSSAGGGPDPDAAALASLGEQAWRRAREVAPDAVPRQVDVVQGGGDTVFRFVSAAAMGELDVVVPASAPSADRWQVTPPHVSPFSMSVRPALDLPALRVGPQAVLARLGERSPDCAPRSLTLFGEGGLLTWYWSCTLRDGRVAVGTVDGHTGVFQPSSAPPAAPPPTALPSP